MLASIRTIIRALSLSSLLLVTTCGLSHADVITVQQVKDLLEKGEIGELSATSYSQGVFDGLIAMEYLKRTETGEAKEFCILIDAAKAGHPVVRQGRKMDAVFSDLALNFLSKNYGCRKGP